MIKFKLLKLKSFFKKYWRKIFLIVFIIFVSYSLINFLFYLKNLKKNTIAIVNGYKITFDDILTKVELSPSFYKDYLKIDPKFFVDEYINHILLFQKAKKYEKNYEKEINNKLKNYYIDLLVNMYVEREITKKIKVSEEEIKDYYNKNINDFVIPEKVHLYEIVTDSKEKAKNILTRLSMGEPFEEIAEKESISESAKNGGDIGWVDVSKLEPEIAALVTKIKPGQILANVFKTDIGYHIIKLAGKTDRRILSLDEAKQTITNILKTQKKKKEVEKIMKELREKSKIQIFPNKIEMLKERIK